MAKYNYPPVIPFRRLLAISTEFTKNPIPFQKQFFDTYGDSVSIGRFFGKKVILSRDLELTKHILQKNHKSYIKSEIQSKHLAKYIGYGLLTSNGAFWKKQRRLIQPAFHKEKLKRLVAIMELSIKEQLTDVDTSSFIDVYPLMNRLAFKVVAQSLFHFSIAEDSIERLQFIIEKLQEFVVLELRRPHVSWWYTISGAIAKHKKLAKESREIILQIINERKNAKDTHDDLLDMLLHATYEDGTYMSNEQLVDEILIIFVAGHETTANSLSFTLGLLAKHPENIEEISTEIAALDTEIAFDQLAVMPHIKNCVEESLRLYPPAWITDRVNIEDDTVAGYHIKKGTLIGVSIYELHRNNKYWDQPNAFLPNRFKGFIANKKPEAYMPFGAGPRLCIGNGFAMYEMMLTLKELFLKYEITAHSEDFTYNPLITLRPVNIKVKFSKRKK